MDSLTIPYISTVRSANKVKTSNVTEVVIFKITISDRLKS